MGAHKEWNLPRPVAAGLPGLRQPKPSPMAPEPAPPVADESGWSVGNRKEPSGDYASSPEKVALLEAMTDEVPRRSATELPAASQRLC